MWRKHYVATAAMLAGERALARTDAERRTIDNIARSLEHLSPADWRRASQTTPGSLSAVRGCSAG